MAQGLFAPGIINENSAHGFGCGVEEMDASVPLDVLHSGKAQPGLVNEGGRLQSLARSFTGHFVGCQAPELVIDQRKQFLRGLRIATCLGFENTCDVADVKIIPFLYGEDTRIAGTVSFQVFNK